MGQACSDACSDEEPNIKPKNQLGARAIKYEQSEPHTAAPGESQQGQQDPEPAVGESAAIGYLDTHHNGVAALLEAMKRAGQSSVFEPLSDAFEQVLVESSSSAYNRLEVKNTAYDQKELTVEVKQGDSKTLKVLRTLDLVPGATPEALYLLTQDVNKRAEWEAKSKFSNKQVRLLQQRVAGKDETWLLKFPGMLMVSGREFVDRRISYCDIQRRVYVVITAVATDVSPEEDKKFVRGETIFQGNVCYGTPDGAAHYMIALADPKGKISASLVNSQSKKQSNKWHKALKEAFQDYATSPEGIKALQEHENAANENAATSEQAQEGIAASAAAAEEEVASAKAAEEVASAKAVAVAEEVAAAKAAAAAEEVASAKAAAAAEEAASAKAAAAAEEAAVAKAAEKKQEAPLAETACGLFKHGNNGFVPTAAAAEEAAALAEEEEGVRGSSTHVDLSNLKDSGTGELSAEEFAALRAKTKSAAEIAKNMTPEQQAAYGCKQGVAASAVRPDSDDSDDEGADFVMGAEGQGALLADY